MHTAFTIVVSLVSFEVHRNSSGKAALYAFKMPPHTQAMQQQVSHVSLNQIAAALTCYVHCRRLAQHFVNNLWAKASTTPFYGVKVGACEYWHHAAACRCRHVRSHSAKMFPW